MNDFNIEDAAQWYAIGESECDALTGMSKTPMAEAVSVALVQGSNVRIEAIDWIWPGWLAAGKLHLIGGSPGTGKTTIATSLAATITNGGHWPDGSRAKRGSIVFWSGEDDISDTLAPRLVASGADMARVYMLSGAHQGGEPIPFDPAHHMPALQDALTAIPDVRLIVVDPIVSAIAGDSHKNADVRRGLQPLVDMGMQLGAAVLGVTHLSKGTAGRDPAERITGSIGFVALARVVFLTVRQQADGDEPARRLLLRTKSNIGPMEGGFTYDLQQGELPGHPGVTASSVGWGAAVEGSTRELMAMAESPVNDDAGGALSDATAFLDSVLSMGPRSVPWLKAESKAAGIAWVTLERAKRKAGVESRKNGPAGYWEWFRMATKPTQSSTPSLYGVDGVDVVDGVDTKTCLKIDQHSQVSQHSQENRVTELVTDMTELPQPINSPASHVIGEADAGARRRPGGKEVIEV